MKLLSKNQACSAWLRFALGQALGLLLTTTALHADSFENANKLFDDDQFSEAADAYEKLIVNGVSVNLLFNLGNARFKADEYGRAMAAYHRALKLAPRHPDIAANLRIVHQKALTEPMPTSLRQQWLRNLSLGEWTAIASFFVTLFLILLTLKQIRKGSENALWIQLTGGITVVSALLLTMAAADYFGNEQAFAVRHGVIVHTGPLEQSPELFQATDGTEFAVIDRSGDFVNVRAGDGSIGWIQSSNVALTKP